MHCPDKSKAGQNDKFSNLFHINCQPFDRQCNFKRNFRLLGQLSIQTFIFYKNSYKKK